MKYVRTNDNRIYQVYDKVLEYKGDKRYQLVDSRFEISLNDIVKQADTIQEVCDELAVKYQNKLPILQRISEMEKCMKLNHITWEEHFGLLSKSLNKKLEWVKLGIHTDEGLIYVAKMNSKGELELL